MRFYCIRIRLQQFGFKVNWPMKSHFVGAGNTLMFVYTRLAHDVNSRVTAPLIVSQLHLNALYRLFRTLSLPPTINIVSTILHSCLQVVLYLLCYCIVRLLQQECELTNGNLKQSASDQKTNRNKNLQTVSPRTCDGSRMRYCSFKRTLH